MMHTIKGAAKVALIVALVYSAFRTAEDGVLYIPFVKNKGV